MSIGRINISGGSDFSKRVTRTLNKAITAKMSKETRSIGRWLRRDIPGFLRKNVIDSAPDKYKGVFTRTMGKVRWKQDEHPKRTGLGYGVVDSTFYASIFANDDHNDDLGSLDYGKSEFWAVVVAIKGRKGYSRELIAVPVSPRRLNKKGLIISAFPKRVKRVKATNWFDEAMQKTRTDISERVAKHFRR